MPRELEVEDGEPWLRGDSEALCRDLPAMIGGSAQQPPRTTGE